MRQSFLLAALLMLSSPGIAQGPDADKAANSGVATSAQAGADPALDKKVCKKSVEIGTLARMTKTCLTRRQWLAISEEAKAAVGDMRESKGYASGQ